MRSLHIRIYQIICLWFLLFLNNILLFFLCFSICHWNLNNISSHNYSKLFLLKAYIIFHKFNIICLSETYLDSTTSIDDDKLQIPGHILIRFDYPSNIKCGVACIYHRVFTVKSYKYWLFTQCLSLEPQVGDKICHSLAFYRSQVNLKTILKPLLIILK